MRRKSWWVWPDATRGIVGLTIGIIITCAAGAALQAADAAEATIDAAVTKVKPALVRIHVVTLEYRQGREIKFETSGSGTIITKEGHIITNHHVAGKANRLVCTLSDKNEVEADLIGTDPLTDISIIKLRPYGLGDFPTAPFGNSAELKVGDPVLAMGSPLALSQSVTAGIVSNTEMTMPRLTWPFDKLTLEGEDVGSIVRWIGHDAAIFGGNSGGPLINLRGEIVGINEISMGLSGAIPGNLAKAVAEKIIKEGRVIRSWTGLEIQPLLKSSGQARGALVSGTIEGSPAEKAGFQPGDILRKLQGHEITVRFPEELPLVNQLMMSLPLGRAVEVVVLRNGREKTLSVTPETREGAQAATRELKAWGIAATDLTLWMVKEMKRTSRDGVLVKGVRPGGPCEEAKPVIGDRDIIVEVAGKPVRNLNELVNVTEEITRGKDKPVPVVVAFERNTERYLTLVKLGTQTTVDPGLEARKAWLPVATQVITRELAATLGIENRTGARVTRVYAGSTAERAGLRVGDLIVALDGQTIPASQPEDVEVFPTMIRQYKIGATVDLTVLRATPGAPLNELKETKIKVELATSPKVSREMKRYRDDNFDFTVRDLTFTDKAQEQWKEEQEGVWVDAVGEGGWAALGRLAVGDLILSVDQQRVPNVQTLERIMKGIGQTKPKEVVFQVRRGIHNLYIELQPSWTPGVQRASGK